MRVLVTGGSGMVGYGIKSIKDNFDYEFNFLSSQDCDLTNYENTYSYFEEYDPDYVIHLAAYIGGLFTNW